MRLRARYFQSRVRPLLAFRHGTIDSTSMTIDVGTVAFVLDAR